MQTRNQSPIGGTDIVRLRSYSGHSSQKAGQFITGKADLMGKAILLWFLGVPIPVILLLLVIF